MEDSFREYARPDAQRGGASGHAGMYTQQRDLKAEGFPVRAARLVDRVTAYISGSALMLILLFTLLSMTDISEFNARGMNNVKNMDLDSLIAVNPDTVAWLTVDGTHIDYPVVQGKDNFEYLDLDIYRNYYAGGTLFLDKECRRDFSGGYSLIHGHHMSEGAMFGDLDKFLDKDFLNKNHTGTLKTPDGMYRLDILAAGTADAYDAAIYSMKGSRKKHVRALIGAAECVRKRSILKRMASDDGGAPDGASLNGHAQDPDSSQDTSSGKGKKYQVLVLSTCKGAMDDSRTVVVCRMIPGSGA